MCVLYSHEFLFVIDRFGSGRKYLITAPTGTASPGTLPNYNSITDQIDTTKWHEVYAPKVPSTPLENWWSGKVSVLILLVKFIQYNENNVWHWTCTCGLLSRVGTSFCGQVQVANSPGIFSIHLVFQLRYGKLTFYLEKVQPPFRNVVVYFQEPCFKEVWDMFLSIFRHFVFVFLNL